MTRGKDEVSERILKNRRRRSTTATSSCFRVKWIQTPIARLVRTLYRPRQRQSPEQAVYLQKVTELNCPPCWLCTVVSITEYRLHLQHTEPPQAWGETWHFLLPAGLYFLKPGRTSVKVGCLHGRPCKMPRRVIYALLPETKEEIQWEFSNERSGQWNIFITILSES